METKEKKNHRWLGTYWIAILFMAVGVLLLGRNLGFISSGIYHIFVSWQMLLIVLGVYMLAERKYVGSLVLVAVGTYFLLPRFDIFYDRFDIFFWPVVLIAIGILFMFKVSREKSISHHRPKQSYSNAITEDGVIWIENSFGAVQQIVTDDYFRGGTIKNSFGSVVLDLRRTSLPEGVTYLDINTNFGGVEIYMPSHWNLKSELHPFLGGFEDSRMVGLTAKTDRSLILRGNVSFSGVEVKG